jgi:hypothetical protein
VIVRNTARNDERKPRSDGVDAHSARTRLDLAGVQPGAQLDAQRFHGVANCHGAPVARCIEELLGGFVAPPGF